jgi:DNA-binding beta-propeller fold protein YncE
MKPICYFLPIFAILLLIAGCDKNNEIKPAGEFSNCVFIINEGPFSAGTGTISAFDRDSLRVTPDLFETINGRPLGNIVQSLTVFNEKAFIVVHKANKIEVVNQTDFKSVATINGLALPRYFIGLNQNRGYVSCWDSSVKVINLTDYSVLASITTDSGPDEMVLAGDYLFVINSGGLGNDSTVTVISTNDQEAVDRIVVGDNPYGIKKDVEGKIWVLCSGIGWNGFPKPGDSPGKLVCIDPVNHEIIKEFNFPDTLKHPNNLTINGTGDTLYYNHPAGIFTFPVSGTSLNAQPLIPGNTLYYGLGYDPVEKMIYVADALDYAQNGWVYRYLASDGTPIDSLQVGILPNGFCFNSILD